MRALAIAALLAASLGTASATTLQQLSLDEMSRQSTAIVRARMLDSHAALHNGDVYTVYRFTAVETLKAAGSQPLVREVAVPGGVAGGIRQAVEGAPTLQPGAEYVLFLWTSRSGLTQIMGLSQGLFRLRPGSAGEDATVRRAATGERMLDAAGRLVRDNELVLRWSELRAQVYRALSGRGLTANIHAEGR
jgi:hypothetical protein